MPDDGASARGGVTVSVIWTRPGAIGGAGAAAGRLSLRFGVAVDRAGRVYVGDTGNARISVFEGDGRSAFAFGWDVVPGNDDVGFEACTTSCKAGTAGRRAGEVAIPTAWRSTRAAGSMGSTGTASTWSTSEVPVVKRSCLRPGARKPSRCPR